jgi:peptidyl-prolyl cis-trans isomerase C
MSRLRGLSATLSAAVFALLLTGVAPWAAAQETDESQDPEVARVDGESIRMSDVMEFAATLPAEYQAQFDQILPFIIERLVDFHLLDRAAGAAELADDEEVKARVAKLTTQVVREVYLQRLVTEAVDEAAVNTRYEAYVAENPPVEEVKARHILIEAEEDAAAIIAELDGGADFAQLAEERSTGPSATSGGDLGYFVAGQMVPSFSEAAFALEPGSYTTAPVQTEFGWHVILVEDRREQAPPAFEEMEAELRAELQRAAVDTFLAELRAGAEIEILAQEAPEGDAEAAE